MTATNGSTRSTAGRQAPQVLDPAWTMRVRDFGPVAAADIQMAPLVLLVGKNNTGKSYIASLLWMVLTYRYGLQRNSRHSPRRSAWFANLIERAIEEKAAQTISVSKRELDSIGDMLTQHYRADNGRVVKDNFSSETIDVPDISIEILDRNLTVNAVFDATVSGIAAVDTDKQNPSHPTITYRIGKGSLRYAANNKHDFVANLLFDHLVTGILDGFNDGHGEALYIPAARTGLMLAFPRLVSDLLNNLSLRGRDIKDGTLPRPVIAFLQALTEKYPQTNTKLQKIVRDLEERILVGQVKSSRSEVPDFTYHPAGYADGLPLHITSSMVTELAPFLLLIKGGRGGSGIVFEEPEAHLHLSAQMEMAKAIIRIVNAGIPVVVTTHSDTFVQKINNLLHLYNHPKKASLIRKFGYRNDEILNPDLARAYEFVAANGRTTVRPVVKKEEGFVVESLNEAIIELANETMIIQE